MQTRSFAAAFLSIVLTASLLAAQETPEFPKPQQEHEWLKQFVGEWETEGKSEVGPAMACKGTLRSRMLGGFWVITEAQTDVEGTSINAVQTIGYDPETKKYVGTWVDSMINYLWKYEGAVDETGKTLTLEAEGPNFVAPGKTAKFRDVYEFKSPDHIVTTSLMQGDDGKWIPFMTGHAKRKK